MMLKIKLLIKRIFNYWKCKINNAPNNCAVHYTANIRKAQLGGYNKISRRVNVSGTSVGFASYLGMNSNLPNCSIGKFCSIAGNVCLLSGQHPTRNFVCTHPVFYSTAEMFPLSYVTRQKFDEFRFLDGGLNVLIGNDVWIGSNVLIMQGVTIGDGAVVGAGAIVTRDIPPYAVAVGVPAKIIKYRFDEEKIRFLLDLKWWNKDNGWIERASEYFDDINKLKLFLTETEIAE